jgi:hypothetical protein
VAVMTISRHQLKEKAYRELKEFLVIALYLYLIFGLLMLYKSAILAEQHISFAYHGLAAINALALAKVMLLAKGLHVGEHYDDRPLIYPTLFKSALFTLVLVCFKILEDAAIGLYHGKTFRGSIADLAGGTWQGILTLSLLLFVVLIPFVGFGELQRRIGKDKLAQVFFHERQAQSSPAS